MLLFRGKGYVKHMVRLHMSGNWSIGENVPHRSTSSHVTSLNELLHRTQMSRSALIATQLVRRTVSAVTTCRLLQSHHGARSYLKDPAYPSTTPVYDVTTLESRVSHSLDGQVKC
jgi:hypothetical protein